MDVTFTSPPYNRKRNDTYKYYDDTLEQYYDKIQQVIVWNKNNPTPSSGNSITNAYELFIVISDNPVKTNGGYIKNSITTNVNTKKFEGHGAVMKKRGV